jgi:uncharacterized protein DUF4349
MRKLTVSIFAFLALSAVVGFIATGGLSGAMSEVTAGAGGAEAAIGSASRAPTDTGLLPALGGPEAAVGGGGSAADVASATGPIGRIGDLPAIGPAVVKTASLEVQVAKGDFDQAFQTAMQVAARYGGYVQSSSTSGTRVRSGSLTIRVPSSAFDRAMADLSGLGTVQSRSISGQDVTNEYVDLNARLRTWEAQEAVLLRLMKRATSVEATLRVQSNLQDVQFRIEQIKGQLRVLSNQTELATIDVGMHEPGVAIKLQQRPRVDERPSLAEAWRKAVDGFLGVLYATVVGLGYLVPIALIAAAVWFGVRRLRVATSSS